MVLQPVRRTAAPVTRSTGGLLLRLFTLIPDLLAQIRNGFFCYAGYAFTDIFSLRSTAPCVARTFLSPFQDSDRTTCYLFL